MGYPTTAELVAASTVEEQTGLTDPQQDALRDSAIDAVEGFARQSFEAEGSEVVAIVKASDVMLGVRG